MTRRHGHRAAPALVLLVAGLLAAAGPASAIYVVTPLRLHASAGHAEVGETLSFTVEPQNGTEAAAWAGKTVAVRYAYDAAETKEGASAPDEPTSSDSMRESELLAALALDDGARATFEWTVPEELRDRNVDVKVVSAEGHALAFAHVAIGEAPPQMRLMAGSGPAGEPAEDAPPQDPVPEGAEPATGADGGADAGGSDEARGSDVPGFGVLAALVGAGAVALLAARRARGP